MSQRKMHFYILFSLKLFLNLIILLSLNAYPQEIRFRHLTINDGLSQNAVFAILQDSKGFMWFGTKDGLNHYDGYTFKVFNNNPFDSMTISNNYITALYEDSRGLIWVGTLDGGINIFQYETGKFRRLNFIFDLINEESLEITSIAEDSDTDIWIGTKGNGLYRLSILNNELSLSGYKQFFHIPGSDNSLSNNNVTSLFRDSKGILWVGTNNKLNRFNFKDENFTHFSINTKHPEAPSDVQQNSISTVYEDNKGRLWLGTLSGVVLFDRGNGKYKLFPHRYEIFRYGWGNIKCISEDINGKLWLAAAAELMRFDPDKKSYEYFRNNPLDMQSISFNNIANIYRDRTGIYWFGTVGGGVSIYDPKAARFSTLFKKIDLFSRTTGFSIRSILEDNSGIVWISTEFLHKWNRKTGEFKSYEVSSNELYSFGNTGAWSMIQSSDEKLWVATMEGLYRYDPLTEKSRRYQFNSNNFNGLPQKEVYCVFEDLDRVIWVVTENYFSKFTDIEKGTLQHFRYLETLPKNEQVRPVIFQDIKKRYWLGTKNGLFLFNDRNGSFTEFRNNPREFSSINNNHIKSICADPFEPGNILWIGTAGGGLNRFNINENTFTHFTEYDGLPNNVVYGILPDKNGNLWLSTNKGLSCFNIKTKSFRNYNVNDGLQSNEFNTGAYFLAESGEMFFGGINGLNYFYPWKVNDNPHIPPVEITGFKILNRQVTLQQGQPVLKYFKNADHIILSYNEDFIQFEFAALDYSAPEKNQYAYKLENFNNDWIYSGTVRTAAFTNLSPGEYVFRVKGSNNDGIWNEEGIAITLVITPPWWNTWWAYVIYGLLFLSGLYWIRHYELNRLKLKNQLKLEKVETDTLRNLDQVKSHFFANISHEFRTPLTLILGQVESVMSSNIEIKEKSKLQVANRNARRLLTLINQLLDLSKLEAGSMKLSAEQHNIVSFLKGLFYSFESLAETQKISLRFETELENIPVFFDPDKMEKVLYNLLSNAFKFTPAQGEIKVSIKIAESSTVEIRVKDSGTGIPPDRLSHIFDRFYQVDSSLTREHEGTGIGLALAKELVELHKGKITVNSKEGEGTEFIVKLPLGDFKIEKEHLVELPADKFFQNNNINDSESIETNRVSGIGHPVSKDKREIILIVEDNSDVRAYIREQLENNYKIVEAVNGEDGILKAQEIPDLIITDVMMPKMDGYQFSKGIRKDEKTSHIPIIMLTAKAALDDKIEGLETGVDDYLTKPFSPKELMVRVKNLIYQREQLRNRFSRSTVIKPSEVSAVSIDQAFLEKVIKIIEKHFEDEKFSVEKLADEVFMSISQLNRKLNALIGQPPGNLIRSLRLQRAADLLKQNAGSVAEICYKVGFNDQAYFSRAFKKQFGVSPSEYKNSHPDHELSG